METSGRGRISKHFADAASQPTPILGSPRNNTEAWFAFTDFCDVNTPNYS